MALTVCPICKQHIVNDAPCVQCTPTLNSKSVVHLAVPLALLMGLGCHPKATEPEVMALYGGPPVEFEPAEEATDTDKADKDESTSTEPPKTESPQAPSLDQKSEEISEPKMEIIEHMQALYGVPNIIPEPVIEEIQEIHEVNEVNEENLPEDKDDVDAGEDD